MCGIAGIVEFKGAEPTEKTLWAMTTSLDHRGPDDASVFVDGVVGLGHARLRIIDLSSLGRQPMASADSRYQLVYNGEVYNFRELRHELELLGHRFRGRSDSEVVLKAWEQWGEAVLPRLEGMFAIALWDAHDRRLWLARDRFGIKPLYYARSGAGIVFGSEPKALLASGRVARRLDPQALHEYLWYGHSLGEATLFADVKELLPGQLLLLDETGSATRSFAPLEPGHEPAMPFAEATRGVRVKLEAAVRSHLVADVPVGCLLSGGIDSTAIATFAHHALGHQLRTFTVGFDFASRDERALARATATRLGTTHTELEIKGAGLPEVIESLVRAHDLPFADAANIPLYLITRELQGSIKVLLQGDGGDEIFAGYRRYGALRHQSRYRALARVAAVVGPLLPRTPVSERARRFLAAFAPSDPALRMALLLTRETLAAPPTAVLSNDAHAAIRATDAFARYRELHHRFRDLDPVQRMLFIDASLLLPKQFLDKVDRATMANGIEVRVPFLDQRLATYAMGLPSAYKVDGAGGKRVLRAALRGVVPDTILDGPKTGFSVPYEQWLAGPLYGWASAVLLDPANDRQGLFDLTAIRQRLEQLRQGRGRHGFLLWKLLQLALWQRTYLD